MNTFLKSGASILLATLSFNASASLIPRLGGQAYYDNVLDITWLANANAAGTSMTWADANTWVTNLTLDGINGWRLPNADVNGDGTVVNCSGGGVAGCNDNEMGFLFWQENISATLSAPFNTVLPDLYWSGTDLASSPTIDAWFLFFSDGFQGADFKQANGYAWAVRDGDVGAVPVPAAVWLFGSGLLGLAGVARRKQRN